MGKNFERHKLPKLTQEICTLNSPMAIKEIKFLVKNLNS